VLGSHDEYPVANVLAVREPGRLVDNVEG